MTLFSFLQDIRNSQAWNAAGRFEAFHQPLLTQECPVAGTSWASSTAVGARRGGRQSHGGQGGQAETVKERRTTSNPETVTQLSCWLDFYFSKDRNINWHFYYLGVELVQFVSAVLTLCIAKAFKSSRFKSSINSTEFNVFWLFFSTTKMFTVVAMQSHCYWAHLLGSILKEAFCNELNRYPFFFLFYWLSSPYFHWVHSATEIMGRVRWCHSFSVCTLWWTDSRVESSSFCLLGDPGIWPRGPHSRVALLHLILAIINLLLVSTLIIWLGCQVRQGPSKGTAPQISVRLRRRITLAGGEKKGRKKNVREFLRPRPKKL